MRTRLIRQQTWLSDSEKALLVKNAKVSGLSQEGYMRMLITGYVPKAHPPADYLSMLKECMPSA